MVSKKKPDFVFLMETKVGRIHAERVRVRIGYEGLFYVDNTGRSGGLALLWKKNNTARLLGYSKTHIDVEVSIIGFPNWRMTCYYGYSERTRRTESWDLLKLLATQSDLPWIVIGDFNDLLYQYEKKGGNPHPNSLLRGFGETIDQCGLAQLPMTGYQFTWKTGKGTPGWIQEKLDKVLVSDQWRDIVNGATVANLMTRKSDHSAIFMAIRHYGARRDGARRFRFEMAWLYDEGCRTVVAKSWEEGRGGGTQNCIRHCGNRLTRWGGDRYHKFGEKIVLLRKRQDRLRGCTDPASLAEYNRLEVDLCREEMQEDVYWRQRAKQHWLKDADANTKFYHRYASNRRKKNTLIKIMDNHGDWVEGDSMTGVVLDYFKHIFTSSNPMNGDLIFSNVTPQVSQAQNVLLVRPFEIGEVRDALFEMYPDKAPGPDGMNPGFYHNFWDIVGSDVSNFIVNCLNTCSLPPSLNNTDVVLIPKKDVPEQVSDLRPIALSNIIYRIMAKMITQRMKPLMDSIISESQSAFIPGRLITDNILIASEEANEIKGCISLYEKLSGQALNYHKSRIKKAAFAYIEDKIRQRIGSCNKKLLSQAGKEVLLKSVAQAMPTFSMSVFLLPVSVCTAIERLMNRYWWGSGTDQRIHWKAWDKLCIPKKYGGLGFKDLRAFNVALLGKQTWRLLTNTESLVSKVYKARYYPKQSFTDAILGNNPSHCWRSIMAAKGLICSGVRRRVGNGKSTSVWGHPWLQDEEDPMIQIEMPPQLSSARVVNLIDQETGTWDHDLLTDIFEPNDVARILKIPVSPDYDDMWYWHGDPRGYYTVKNGYRCILGNYENTGNMGFTKWLTLWKQKIPPKYSDGVAYPAAIIYHLWRARNAVVWEACLPRPRRLVAMAQADFAVWRRIHGSTLTTVMMPTIPSNNATAIVTAHQAKRESNEISMPHAAHHAVTHHTPTHLPPKCYVDAGYRYADNTATVGAVLIGPDGQFISAYSAPLPHCFSPLMAEAYACKEALSWIRDRGEQSIELFTDCQTLQSYLTTPQLLSRSYIGYAIDGCRNLISTFNYSRVNFIPRSHNYLAHSLASTAFQYDTAMYWDTIPPDAIAAYL
ncbi:PREDICTED: uncharacterized protein LOC109163029 [Ipomoea nil]|uniref:uncharacterized protein LOC109163029 n=1 Tax=Ipomoea nil TaxID=35883 RepID=UPI000901A2AD|nr:PREDICTED: uncharacterized protein LOC109163029 [Ipomoea nil]